MQGLVSLISIIKISIGILQEKGDFLFNLCVQLEDFNSLDYPTLYNPPGAPGRILPGDQSATNSVFALL